MQERLARLKASLGSIDESLAARLEEIGNDRRFTQEHRSELGARAREEAATRASLLVDAAVSEAASAASGVSRAIAEAFKKPPAPPNGRAELVPGMHGTARKQYLLERLKQRAATAEPADIVAEYRDCLRAPEPDYDAIEVFDQMGPGLLKQRAAAERRAGRPAVARSAQMAGAQVRTARARAARALFTDRIARATGDMRAVVDFLIERSRTEQGLYGAPMASETRRKAKTLVGTFARI